MLFVVSFDTGISTLAAYRIETVQCGCTEKPRLIIGGSWHCLRRRRFNVDRERGVPVKAQLLSSTVKADCPSRLPQGLAGAINATLSPERHVPAEEEHALSAVIQGSNILTISSPQLTPYD